MTIASANKFDVHVADQAVGVRPETAIQLMRFTSDKETNNKDIQDVIDRDPNMAMRVLKLANSAFYGMRNRVVRIDRAISLLGGGTIAKLAASCSMDAAFKGIKIDAPGVTPDTPRKYATSVAFAADVVVQHFPSSLSVATRKLGAEAFVCGLIHDIGTVVQAKLHTKQFVEAVNSSIKTGLPLHMQERKFVGYDHAWIGQQLAEFWQLPKELIHGIGCHAEPLEADPEHQPLACVVHISSHLVRRAGVASFDGDTDTPMLEDAMNRLRIDPLSTEKMVVEVRQKIQAAGGDSGEATS